MDAWLSEYMMIPDIGIIFRINHFRTVLIKKNYLRTVLKVQLLVMYGLHKGSPYETWSWSQKMAKTAIQNRRLW